MIQAISIPQKIVPLSHISIDQDLDMGSVYKILTDLMEKSSAAGLVINAESIDAMLKTQYFTAVDGAGLLNTMTGVFTSVATDYESIGTLAIMPPGMVSGTLGFQVTLVSDNASGTAYARPYNLTKAAYIATEMSQAGTTPSLKYTSQVIGAALQPGDVLQMRIKSNNALYQASATNPAIRGTLTFTFQPGTIVWI